jgi:hypothetical protein
MLKVLSLAKIAHTHPPRYELRLYDSSENNRGYVLLTEHGTNVEIRKKLRDVGISEGKIDLLFSDLHRSHGKRKNA